jgi:hypothetical protein
MKTASELQEEYEQVAGIAHGDDKNTFAAITPYLSERRLAAQHYIQNPNPKTYEYIQAINEKIAKMLYIF